MTSATDAEFAAAPGGAAAPGVGSCIAWQWLDKAEQLGDPDLSLLKADWHFDPLRKESRFKAIEARMNYLP
jgi:hypothetical protein